MAENSAPSDLPKMLHIAVHGEEDSMVRLLQKGSGAVETYAPLRTYPLIRKLKLDRDIDYSSRESFLESVKKNFERNGIPFSGSFRNDRIVFHVSCPIAATVHPAIPIRKCLIAKYVAALLFRFTRMHGLGAPVLSDSKFTKKGSANTILFVRGASRTKRVRLK